MFYTGQKKIWLTMTAFAAVTVMTLSSFRSGENTAPTPYKLELPKDIPPPHIPVDNQLTVEGVELGRKLFNDKMLSADHSVACVTCHSPQYAFTDQRKLSEGIAGKSAARNAMPLFNMAWVTPYFWDGRVKTLEELIVVPLTNASEMGKDVAVMLRELNASQEYTGMFQAAFGTTQVTDQLVYKAIAQYLRTITSFVAPVDTMYDTAVRVMKENNVKQREAFKIMFNLSDKGLDAIALCEKCHSTVTYGNLDMRNNGLDAHSDKDKGLGAITGKPEDMGKFKAPSVRNLLFTAPYMHDGRFATLEEVIEHYNSGIQPHPNLDPLLKNADGTPLRLNLDERAKRELMFFITTLTTDSSFIQRVNVNY